MGEDWFRWHEADASSWSNDVGGTLNGENISRAAGAKHGQMLGKPIEELCQPLGENSFSAQLSTKPSRSGRQRNISL